MQSAARKRTFLFLACAAVLLAAGYGLGYSRAHDQFYAPESLLANEVVSLDFNNRLMHYANLNQPAEVRRELLSQLRKQAAYVDNLAADCRDPGSRRDADQSVRNARQVIAGGSLALGATPPATAPAVTQR